MACSLSSQQQQLQHQTDAATNQVNVIQTMVEGKLESLRVLRNRKEESQSDVIQKEKNLLEGKLMILFAKQLYLKIKSGIPPYQVFLPQLQNLLYVVDVKEDMMKEIHKRCKTVEEMCTFTDEKIGGIFYSHNDDKELANILSSQCRRLRMALNTVCSYVGRLQNGEKTGELQLSSWQDTLPESPSGDIRAPILNYLQEFNVPTDDIIGQPTFIPGSRSIPPSPTASRSQRSSSTIPRSQSEEMNVGYRVALDSTSSTGSTSSSQPARAKSFCIRGKQRPANIIITREPGDLESENSKSRSSSVSQSPRTPNAANIFRMPMRHTINHRFSAKQLLISIACDHCHRLMFIGLKCKDCGFKCHKKCSANVTPSCGLPDELLKFYKNRMQELDVKSRIENDTLKRTTSVPSDIVNQIQKITKPTTLNRSVGDLQIYATKEGGPINDSGSITSTASSMSSSPFQSDSGTPADPDHRFDNNKFSFPDTSTHLLVPDDNLLETLISTTSTIKSEESTDTYTNPEDSEQSKSSTEKSNASTVSYSDEFNSMDELHNQISDVPNHVPNHVKLRDAPLSRAEKQFRLSLLHVQGSLMSEWVIPFSEIEVGELIGKGRVGKVFRSRWHGEVALKMLYLENPTSEEKHDFKYKVQVLRRTRHENLILFMGACMEPPRLAIVCSLCKGNTLYTHIHDHGITFADAKLIDIVKQISHGMNYLHANGIVHRDLKTKNIFLEGNKIVITDFGLISVLDIKVTNRRPNHLMIPKGWLCYQAPEIIRKLDPCNPGAEVQFYTKESDVYAFGSVWFEILAGQWPFQGLCPETVLWHIGRGYKQPMSKMEIRWDMKDIFNMIWNYSPADRPTFHDILKAIDAIPRRKLIRSPSQPTYLTRYVNALI